MANPVITAMPGKRTNMQYQIQGAGAARLGFLIEQCPYYESSTAGKFWIKGFKSVKPA